MSLGRPWIVRAAVVCLASSSCLAAVAAADPLAVLASVKGRVEVTSAKGGSPVRATFGRALEKGDKVTVLPGASATVFFDDGNVIELSEKSTITVGGQVARKGAPGLSGEVYANVSKFVTGGSRETGLVALSSLRGTAEATPILLQPRKTVLMEGRPTFRWRAVEGARRYRVALSGDAGDLWSHETTADSLAFPDDAPALAGGDFLWEVRALDDKGELRREESWFHVLAPEETGAVHAALEKIDASTGGAASPAALYLSGSYLSSRGLYGDAVGRFSALSALSPDSPAPHEALGNVYRAVGLMDLAAAEYQRALALNREAQP